MKKKLFKSKFPGENYYFRNLSPVLWTRMGCLLVALLLAGVNKTMAQIYTVATVAGNSTYGYLDGTGTSAQFAFPSGVAVDAGGNIFVADASNNRIRKITSAGVVTTLAGNGTAGFADGPGTSAEFSGPNGVAVDASGNVYVADAGNNSIRKITPDGVVTTFAGNGTAGFADGTGTSTEFNNPLGVAVDVSGNIYVADEFNQVIRKITSAGVVTTLAGDGTSGFIDNCYAAYAEFSYPAGVAVDAIGNIYVADQGNNAIRYVTPDGDYVFTIASSYIYDIYGDLIEGGPDVFNNPTGVAVDASYNIYVADEFDNRIRIISPSSEVMTIAGDGTAGFADGLGASAAFNTPSGVAVDARGKIYVADQSNNRIRKIVPIGFTNGSTQSFAVCVNSGAISINSNLEFTDVGSGLTETYSVTSAPTHGSITTGSAATSGTSVSPTGWAYTPTTGYTGTDAFTIQVNNGSSTVSTMINVTVNALPTVSASSASVCVSGSSTNNTVSLSGSPSGGTWTVSGGTLSGTTYSNATAGSYTGTYTYTDGNSCTNTATNTITVNSTPTAGATSDISTITCTNATATFTATGGGSYLWDDASASATRAVMAGGTYSVTVTNATNGCSASTTIAVGQNTTAPTVSATASSSVCPGTSVTLSGSGALSYSWTGGVTDGTAFTPSATYTVTGTAANGCTGTGTSTVTVLPVYAITASAGSNGSISPSGSTNVCSGNNQAYTISANTGYHIQDVLVDGVSNSGAISSGSYAFTGVTAAHTISTAFASDCIAPSITCSGDVTQVADAGLCSGTVIYSAATATGTTPTITYSQNSGTSFPVGTTMVTATATNGCGTVFCNFNVNVTPNSLGVTVSHTNVSCNSGSNGTISTTVTGGTGAYTYAWTGGATGANPTGLAAGTYNVTVSDAGCSEETPATTSATITEPSAISFTATVTQPTCSYNTGSVALSTPTGGTGAITYDGTATTGLTTGPYTYTATDVNGCTDAQTVSVINPPAIAITATPGVIACNGGSTSVAVSATGGTGSLTGTGTYSVSAGTFSYTVSDAHSCSASTSVTVTQPSVLSITGTTESTSCSAAGGVTTSVTGGTPAYTYLWSNGATTPGISGLETGSYSVTVTDAHSCTAFYTTSVTLTPRTVLVRLVSSTGAGIAGGTVQYYNGSWMTMGTTDVNGYACMNFPTSLFSTGFTTYFQVLYAGGVKEWNGIVVASNPVLVAKTTNVSLELEDHTGALITSASGTAGLYTGSWGTVGTTGSAGYVSKELLPGSYYFNMNYSNYTQQQYVTIGTGPTQNVVFQTTLVTLNLQDHTGALITSTSGTGGYYSGGWYTMGSTGGTGQVSKELLPGSGYYFNMNYNNYTEQQAVTVAATLTQTVTFQTTLVTLNLQDHTGALITSTSGTGGYYSGGWYTMGSTGGTGQVSKELLPGSGYYFNMNYNNYTQQQAVTVAATPTQTVTFQTTLVTLNLQDHTGALITSTSGTGGWYSGGWYTMGTTGSTGQVSKELLPGSGYYFNMNYNNYTEQQAVTVAATPTQTVTFQTTLVTLNLQDHTGALITSTSGTGGWYSGGWYAMGSTGGTGQVSKELLPGSGYYFNMNYNNYSEQQAVTVTSGPTQNVNFQTTLVTLNLLDHTGTPITATSGTGGWYSGGWYTMGGTGTSGNVSMELLPGTGYYFNMNYNHFTQQQAVTVGAGPTQNVNFQTTLVTLNLLDHTGSLITSESGTGGFYAGGWYTMGSTGGTGSVSAELLPGSGYYFNMSFHNGTQQIGSMTVISDPLVQQVSFQTAIVTVHYKYSTGAAISGATIGYYSGGWYTMGATDAEGNVAMEMLPVPYYYNATMTGLPTVSVGPFTDAAAGTPTHVITASGTETGGRSSSAGLSGGDNPDNIVVYPNPAKDQVQLIIPGKYTAADLTLEDVTGQILSRKSITDNTGMPVTLPLGNIAAGSYLLKVNAGQYSTVVKLIVK